MVKLTPNETALVKAFNIVPEDWMSYSCAPARKWDYAAMCQWAIANGMPELGYYRAMNKMIKNLYQKFFDDEGFDGMALDDIAIWVLSNYLYKWQLEDMDSTKVLEFLQSWKYFFGFRKWEKQEADIAKHYALRVMDGTYILDPESADIYYIDNLPNEGE